MDNEEGGLFLERLYDSLRLATKAAGRLKNDSVLASLLGVTSNVRFDLLTQSSISAGDMPTGVVATLLGHGYVLEGVTPYSYMISAKGIWDVERRRGIITPERLVDFIDAKEFRSLRRPQGLLARERVVLLGLIAARSFGEAQPIDLHKPDAVKEQWRLIFEECYDLLDALGLCGSLSKQQLFGKVGNEHPVSNLVRHTDALKKKTGGMFKAYRSQRYGLDVAPGNIIAADRLSYLLRLTVDRQLDISEIDQLYDACKRIAYDECLNIYEVPANPFLGGAHDEAIRRSFLHAFAPAQ